MTDTFEVGKLYCLPCRMCFPVLRPDGAASLATCQWGRTADRCPHCHQPLVFGGVLQLPMELQPALRQIMGQDIDAAIAQLVGAGAHQRAISETKELRAEVDQRQAVNWATLGIKWKEA